MANSTEKGRKGEALAVQFLGQQGFIILFKNWRYRYFEVDIIAHKLGVLHFVEVKYRNSRCYGLPEESVGKKKIRNLVDASVEFLFKYPNWKRLSFDILAISANGDKPGFFLIEDVYL